jgi:hypothetical protein
LRSDGSVKKRWDLRGRCGAFFLSGRGRWKRPEKSEKRKRSVPGNERRSRRDCGRKNSLYGSNWNCLKKSLADGVEMDFAGPWKTKR